MLKIKKIFGPTIQGEGQQAGLGAIFIRFAGCNIWDGREKTRQGNPCYYCDTDFTGGNLMTVGEVVHEVKLIRGNFRTFLVVLTGGEPLLQPTSDLIHLIIQLKTNGFITQMESNGTINKEEVFSNLDYLTISPKKPLAELEVNFKFVTCLKLLYPHPTVPISDFLVFSKLGSMDSCIQPIEEGDAIQWKKNIKEASDLVKRLGFPWRLSLQCHKIIGEE